MRLQKVSHTPSKSGSSIGEEKLASTKARSCASGVSRCGAEAVRKAFFDFLAGPAIGLGDEVVHAGEMMAHQTR